MVRYKKLRDIIFAPESKLVIFDVDGTLVDSIPRHIPTRKDFIKGLIKEGLIEGSRKEKAFEDIKGPISTFWEDYIDHSKMTLASAINRFGQTYVDQTIQTPAFPGSIDSINYLRQNEKAVASVTASLPAIADCNNDVLRKEWEQRGLKGSVFDAEVRDDKVNYPELPVKPSFKAYELLANRLAKNGHKVLGTPTCYVGDGGSDLRFAQNISKEGVKCDFIYVYRGQGDPNPNQIEGASIVFETMQEFYDALRG